MENLDCVFRALSEESLSVYEPPSSLPSVQSNAGKPRQLSGPISSQKIRFFMDSNRILLAKI